MFTLESWFYYVTVSQAMAAGASWTWTRFVLKTGSGTDRSFDICTFRWWTKICYNCFIGWVISISWAILISLLSWETRNHTKATQSWEHNCDLSNRLKLRNIEVFCDCFPKLGIVSSRNDSEHCWQLIGWWCRHPWPLRSSLLYLWRFWITHIVG